MKRPRSSAKAGLIREGVALIEKRGLASFRIDDVVEKADLAKGTFYLHFKNKSAFMIEIHRDFHDRLEAKILDSIEGLTPGRERILRGIATYLDGCLVEKGVKAFLLEARSEPALRKEVNLRNERFSKLMTPDFKAMDFPDSQAAAQLFTALVAEAAFLELQNNGEMSGLRRTLECFLPTQSGLK
ncbi:MAG: TetR/AcrR family transcriptional regulator [Spirochaetia bacterium]|nr:TetR/AcrR family transcriptional regulator [Spirochaetia bacterium]